MRVFRLWAQVFEPVMNAAEQEVRDILNDAAENPGKYDWKMLTVTDWAGYYLCLRKFDSRQIGKALEQCGVVPENRKINNTNTRVRRVPIYRKNNTFFE